MPQNDRAWRFVHPDLDESGEGASAGLQLTSRQNVATVSGSDAVRQSVLLLLSTRPGERMQGVRGIDRNRSPAGRRGETHPFGGRE